jgi:hypothetical protein
MLMIKMLHEKLFHLQIKNTVISYTIFLTEKIWLIIYSNIFTWVHGFGI